MGKLALAGIHLEGTPLEEFADAAWAVQVDYILTATKETAEFVEERWAGLNGVAPAAPAPVESTPTQQPAPHQRAPQQPARRTRDEHGPPSQAEILAWASDPRAQAGQRALMGDFSAAGD